MRSILVGTREQRLVLRQRLNGLRGEVDVVAEFESLAEARASGLPADAILLATPHATSDAGGAELFDDEDAVADVLAESLTPREIEVLELVAQGLANKRIAERLGISDQTVKFHVASLAAKLGAANRTDAVRRGVRRGLITL